MMLVLIFKDDLPVVRRPGATLRERHHFEANGPYLSRFICYHNALPTNRLSPQRNFTDRLLS
jgi:hypothetical protein